MEIQNNFTTRQDFSSFINSLIIINSFFIGCKSSNLGGGFYVSSNNLNFYLIESNFFNCSSSSTSNSAGCGYLKVNNIFLKKVCSNYCFTYDGGSSFRIYQSNIVDIMYFSYSYCSPSTFNCIQESFLIFCNYLTFKNSNSSKNYAKESSSGMALVSYQSIILLSFINIESCFKNEIYSPILLQKFGFIMNYSNIINNTGKNLITILNEVIESKIEFNNCIILYNNFNFMINGFVSFTPSLINCYYQNLNQNNLLILNSNIKITNSLFLNILNTAFCIAIQKLSIQKNNNLKYFLIILSINNFNF